MDGAVTKRKVPADRSERVHSEGLGGLNRRETIPQLDQPTRRAWEPSKAVPRRDRGDFVSRAYLTELRRRVIIAAMVEEPIAFLRAVTGSQAARSESSSGAEVRFERAELNRILTIYGHMVAAGEWRDYAIDFLSDAAAFSIFRRSSEAPLFTIEKRPRLRNRQGQYAVIESGGHVLKRGHDLAQVLRVFDKTLFKARQS
jgi:Protein of unknown function (DUF2794)